MDKTAPHLNSKSYNNAFSFIGGPINSSQWALSEDVRYKLVRNVLALSLNYYEEVYVPSSNVLLLVSEEISMN